MSAVVAFFAGFGLAVLLAVPYIAVSYRRRGELGFGHAVLALGFVVYVMALWTYTLLPIPDTTPAWCAENAAHHLQLRPLQFVADIRREQHGAGLSAMLHNPALQGVLFNVALFVPLGMFLRHLFRRSVLATVLIGFAVSLFIECTQLTGNWYLFACPYRVFDVDDMLTNTLGAAVGFALAPALRLVPWQRASAPPGEPRPVTARRRLLGMAVDLLSVVLLGMTVKIVIAVLYEYGLQREPSHMLLVLLGEVLPAVLLLLVVPLAGNGASFGQRVVLLTPVGPDGGRPEPWRMLLRCAVGSGGFFLLVELGHVDGVFGTISLVLLLVSGVMAVRPQSHRGLSGLIAGLYVVDTRTPSTALTRERETSATAGVSRRGA